MTTLFLATTAAVPAPATKAETDPHHRHISHLWGLFPGAEIDARRTPELARPARVFVTHRDRAISVELPASTPVTLDAARFAAD